MALKFGMVFEQDKDNVIEALIYDIKSLHDGHHACGIHGLRHLYTVLTENGQDELAYKMLTDTTFPGPAYIIDCGLTTWPERQWEWNRLPEWERSLNHPMQGGFTAFMHESLGGIQPSFEAAGYRKFVLKPRLTDQLGWVKTSMESPHGTIRSEWKNEPAKFSWTITVPANSSAEVYFPFGAGKQISEGGEPFAPPCRQIVEDAKVWSVCLIGSGTYHFSITK
jgi:alpha-L-rhamnosidase